jgi:site-specific DNA recombinase
MKSRLLELEREKENLSEELETMTSAQNIVEFHPAMVEAYRKKVAGLQSALGNDECERREAANIIRSLVTWIEIIPKDGRGQLQIKVHGALAELLNLPQRNLGEPPRTALVVAEEGLEPPTRGL